MTRSTSPRRQAELIAHGVRVSSPERALYPGLTKRDLLRYYDIVSEAMLQHVARRPLTLRRYPRGIGAPGFVQQHDTGGLPEPFRSVPIREAEGDVEPHLYIGDAAGLAAAVQMSVLELHGWGSRIDDLEAPDRLVFDLDPDPSVGFAAVVDAAVAIRERLAKVESWPMLSGGKGVHVIVALDEGHDWDMVAGFAKRFAADLAEAEPQALVATMAKAERKRRIFIDWLRNQRGATAVMPFSTRARRGASVAMPVDWDELRSVGAADAFTVRRVLDEGVRLPKGWGARPQRLGA
jgi:bifunctional non-homologous end joining protein LigD